ncbi:hypothetical protein [Nitratireductor sp. XY-223]|uniref:hypothetical protein n=1 Tax=Nitratireductor sp. XY-223 TaxID=2561926 RepID=UPI0010AA3ADD|nr:hypothetical protein [Nitratireductor sp. XY-223]
MVKTLFWFGVVLLFLPGNASDNAVPVGDRSARSAAELRELAAKIQRICQRDPELCRAGAEELLAARFEDDEIAQLLRSEAALIAAARD